MQSHGATSLGCESPCSESNANSSQSIIGRSQVSEITSSRKLPSPLTADKVTVTHRHMLRTLPLSGLNEAMLCRLVLVLTVKGTYLFIAMISTFLGFSWVMSLFNLSAKAMPGFIKRKTARLFPAEETLGTFRQELQCGVRGSP